MRILQINIFFDEGSTGKIVADIHNRLLRDGHDSYVIYGLGDDETVKDPKYEYKITTNNIAKWRGRWTRIIGLRYNCASSSTEKAIELIKRINPGVVHLHCLNCFYINPFKLLKWLGKNDIPVLVTHHADLTITANCDYSYSCEKWRTGCSFHCSTAKKQLHSKLLQFSKFSWLQMKTAFDAVPRLYASGVSRWMADRVKASPMFEKRECRIIENGLDTSSFHYQKEAGQLKQELGYSPLERVILHVTPNLLAPIKGGKYVMELARLMTDVNFIIVGAKGSVPFDIPKNVRIVRHTSSKQELAKYYSMADLTLLTSQKESFSMVTAESLCCGTPVVGFKAGAPETISILEYSEFVDYGDTDTLKNVLYKWLAMDINKNVVSKTAILRYDAERMYERYNSYYVDIIHK